MISTGMQNSTSLENMNTAIDSNVTPTNYSISDNANEKSAVGKVEQLQFCPEIGKCPVVNMIRIPCRARGVCHTHTPQSAYFEIPEDCQDGKSLLCSHKLCRESGRMFRYCKVCDQVTVKRNFSKRHAHGIMARSPVDIARVESINSNSKKRKVSVDVDGKSLDSFMYPNEGTSDGETSESFPSVVPSIVYSEGNSDSTVRMVVTRSEASLLELVRNRPSGREATDRWIQDILLVLDNHENEREQPQERVASLDRFEIFTDNDESEREQPQERMLSLDNFDILTESFDNFVTFTKSFEKLVMK